ncbi:MAG: hypothetical protein Q8Q81_00510 [Oxalobacteraceae bacterium]|nr:hypothetical protein [Oxalobacteraceae bacterium]
MSTTTAFTVGQKVTFTVVRTKGMTINFSSRNGHIHELIGENVVVKSKNGSLHAVCLADLRAIGERNALTDAVLSGLGV